VIRIGEVGHDSQALESPATVVHRARQLQAPAHSCRVWLILAGSGDPTMRAVGRG
jgi:hypothetical protein